MENVNDKILDFQIGQQIKWIRAQNREARVLRTFMREGDIELRSMLENLKPYEGSLSVKKLRELRKEIAYILSKSHDEITEEFLDKVQKTAHLAAETEARMFERAYKDTNVEIKTASMLEINSILYRRTFLGRRMREWVKQMTDNDTKRIQAGVAQIASDGTKTEDMAGVIIGIASMNYKDGTREVSRRGSDAAIRTAMGHAVNAGKQAVWNANAQFIRAIRWVSVLDSKTTPLCRSRDGRIAPVDPSDTFRVPAGETLLYPTSARPPAHINCRSIVVPILLPVRGVSELVFTIPRRITYYEWLKKQSAKTQKDVLGVTRYKLFKNGVDPQRFTNIIGKQLTLPQLRLQIPQAFKDAGL